MTVADDALDRLRQQINKSRATYVPGTPEKYPATELRGLTVLEAEALLAQAEQLREERDAAWSVNEGLRNRLRSDPDGATRWRREAEMYMREFGKQRELAGAAEAESALRLSLMQDLERRGDEYLAELRRLREGLRFIAARRIALETFGLGNVADAADRALADSPDGANPRPADDPHSLVAKALLPDGANTEGGEA